MDAVKYIKEFKRMCGSHHDCSDGCPLKRRCGLLWNTNVNSESIEAIVAIVEKWSKEHPLVTNGMKVLELIPENQRATAFKEAVQDFIGLGLITSEDYVQILISKSWWDAEYKEGSNE